MICLSRNIKYKQFIWKGHKGITRGLGPRQRIKRTLVSLCRRKAESLEISRFFFFSPSKHDPTLQTTAFPTQLLEAQESDFLSDGESACPGLSELRFHYPRSLLLPVSAQLQ